MTDEHAIAQEKDTRWYREYWIKVAVVCLTVLGIIAGASLLVLYWVIRIAVCDAYQDYAKSVMR